MFRILFLVLADLWNFVTTSLFGVEKKPAVQEVVVDVPPVPQTLQLQPPAKGVYISPREAQEALLARVQPSLIVAPVEVPKLAVPKQESDVPLPTTPSVAVTPHDRLLYVATVAGARLYKKSQIDFDAALATVPYGKALSTKGYHGRFVEVAVDAHTGFVLKDDTTSVAAKVWPQFVPGTIYTAEHGVTQLVRQIVRDEFLAGELSLPLQAGEYILVRLMRDQVRISWTPERPRLPGVWHTLLRGVPGIFSSIVAKTDTVMEWEDADGTGRLAYIEAVLPDQTLRLSAIGLVVAGEYSEILVPESVWREWRPVFMSIGV